MSRTAFPNASPPSAAAVHPEAGAAMTIAQIWRYPVKSMAGERLESARLLTSGIELDRGWAVYDVEAQTVTGARLLPALLHCTARYVEGTSAGLVPHVAIAFPDGAGVRSDDPQADRMLSGYLDREVKLIPLTAGGPPTPDRPATPFQPEKVEGYLRMLFGLRKDDPLPDMALLAELGKVAQEKTDFTDVYPIHLITSASLRRLQALVPEADLDIRRFRPNLVVAVDGEEASDVEQSWPDRTLALGDARLRCIVRCLRCNVVAADQPGGIARDVRITRALVKHMGQSFGTYCSVSSPGTVHPGTLVRLNDRG